MAVCTFGAASGFRPIASAEREPIKPIAIAGAIVPTMIVAIVAHNFTASISIVFLIVSSSDLWDDKTGLGYQKNLIFASA